MKKNDLGIARLPMFSGYNNNNQLIEIKDFSDSVIFFISLTCSYCIDLLPHLSSIENKLTSDNILLISTGSIEENKELVTYFGWKFNVLHFDLKDIKEIFGIRKFPSLLLIDNLNNIRLKSIVYDFEHYTFLTKEEDIHASPSYSE